MLVHISLECLIHWIHPDCSIQNFISLQVKCEVIEKASQDASNELFQSFSFQSAACCMFRVSEETLGEVLIQ